jgi:hypothetical protein
MSNAKRLGRLAAMAAALILGGCSNEVAKTPDPVEGSEAPAAAKDSQGTQEPQAAAPESPAERPVAMPASEADEAAEKPGDSGKTAKPSAPVQVAAKIRPGAAELEVVFSSDGTGISVKVWGTDGLKVKSSAEPVTGASVSRGQTLKVSVLFDAPAAQANLAVGVNGMFGGKSQGKVQSFTVNPAGTATTPAGTKDTNSGAIEPAKDSGGRKVKVMKAP